MAFDNLGMKKKGKDASYHQWTSIVFTKVAFEQLLRDGVYNRDLSRRRARFEDKFKQVEDFEAEPEDAKVLNCRVHYMAESAIELSQMMP